MSPLVEAWTGVAPLDDNTSPLSGRLACVTGGGRGIGAEIAERLHSLGADLALVGRTEETLRKICKKLPGSEYHVADVAAPAAVRELFEKLSAPPDILIHNAGSASSAPLHRTTDEIWTQTLTVNLSGVFYCCWSAGRR